ncbi:MAG: hypothetical protein AcusKO_31490 [Acuticoccus sp.]
MREGVLPSFAFVEGDDAEEGRHRGGGPSTGWWRALPHPPRVSLEGTHNLLITGIGGFGRHHRRRGAGDGRPHRRPIVASTLDMTGLAQKNGPVTSHVRFAPADRAIAIAGPRIPAGTLDRR